jgi:hypothetical protein
MRARNATLRSGAGAYRSDDALMPVTVNAWTLTEAASHRAPHQDAAFRCGHHFRHCAGRRPSV